MERADINAPLPKSISWEERIAGFALAVVFFSVVWGVIARYIAPQPATWSNELATLSFAWVVFLGAAAATKERLHLGVDILTSRFPELTRTIISRGVNLIMAVGLIYIAYLAVNIGLKSWERPTPVMRIPYTFVQFAAAIGFASMALSFAKLAIHSKATSSEVIYD